MESTPTEGPTTSRHLLPNAIGIRSPQRSRSPGALLATQAREKDWSLPARSPIDIGQDNVGGLSKMWAGPVRYPGQPVSHEMPKRLHGATVSI